jgi:hypothetical protein
MEEIGNYIFNPQTLVSFIIFVFWLGVTWANLNAKLKEIEKRVDKIEDLDLDSRLTEIQTNLKRIMEKLKDK